MKIMDGKPDFVTPKEFVPEGDGSGRVVCSCGHEFHFDEDLEENVVECYGRVVPFCGKCKGLIEDNRRDSAK